MRLPPLIAAAIATLCASAAPLSFDAADAEAAHAAAEELVRRHSPRDAGTAEGLAAAQWICAQARGRGANAVLDRFDDATPLGVRSFANVVAEFPGAVGADGEWVVLMSHFDTTPNGGRGFQGANDGASTSGLLIALSAAIARSGRLPFNVALVWTDGEECRVKYGPRDGFHGSRRLAASYRGAGRRVRAAICLDMLGDRDLHVTVPANSTPALKTLALRAAKAAGMQGRLSVDDGLFISDDHVAFLHAGYPAVDLIDFEFGSAPGRNDYWHTPQDTMDKISPESLRASGRIVCAMLSIMAAESSASRRYDIIESDFTKQGAVENGH